MVVFVVVIVVRRCRFAAFAIIDVVVDIRWTTLPKRHNLNPEGQGPFAINTTSAAIKPTQGSMTQQTGSTSNVPPVEAEAFPVASLLTAKLLTTTTSPPPPITTTATTLGQQC